MKISQSHLLEIIREEIEKIIQDKSGTLDEVFGFGKEQRPDSVKSPKKKGRHPSSYAGPAQGGPYPEKLQGSGPLRTPEIYKAIDDAWDMIEKFEKDIEEIKSTLQQRGNE